MGEGQEVPESHLARIAAARAELARRKREDPAAVDRYEARMARLTAAAKRERQRFETLVLERDAPPPPPAARPKGMSKKVWDARKKRERDEWLAAQPVRRRYPHPHATPETLEKAGRTHEGALVQLHANGTIDKEQLEWAAEIANVYRSIESDVAVAVASLEARVDQSRSGRDAVGEGVRRVRLHQAYGRWRELLPVPRQMVLDMIVGDAIGYSVAARRYRVHKRKAKRLLLEALDRWPECVNWAYRTISAEDVDRANEA